MSSTEYKDDHADKTLTPRQQAEQNYQTSDAVASTKQPIDGFHCKNAALNRHMVAAAYLHINTGVSFHDAVQTYANIAKSVGTGTISHAPGKASLALP